MADPKKSYNDIIIWAKGTLVILRSMSITN